MVLPQKAEWRFVSVECGVQCALTTGESMMLESSADNLDYPLSVSLIHNLTMTDLFSLNAVPRALRGSTYGGRDLPTLVGWADCTGDERFLRNCSKRVGLTSYCTSQEAAGTMCSNGGFLTSVLRD